MKYFNLVVVVFITVMFAACATKQSGATAGAAPATNQASPKEGQVETGSSEGDIVGKPAKDSKFAKLKIGMTLSEVEKLIGPPTRHWTYPTGKSHIPFYFGPDRWVIKYSYKQEGVLTFNGGGDQLLTRIEVNTAE